MDPVDREILLEFAEHVRAVEPQAAVWAFGSRARGTAHPESDFDLCVVVPELGVPLRRAIRDITWEIGFERDRVLTTVVLSRHDFENGPMSASTLVANIRREGTAA
jgi:predicted nucleotidyltransferase